MQIKAFKNVPCVITFNYEGQEWYYTQAPYLEYWEHDEIREMYKAESFNADDEKRKELNKYRIGHMKVREYDDGSIERYEVDGGIQVAEGYNEWWDELDNIRSQYRPDNFFNRRLGNPKWEDGILQQMFKDGWTPKQALSSWKRYNGAVGHFKRRPLTQASTKICKNCGGQGHNSRSCTNERVRDVKYANDKSTRLKLSRKINALFKL